MIVELKTAQSFDQLAAAEQTLLLDFYMTTCPPCRRLVPELEALDEAGLPLTICKANAVEVPELSDRYGVRGVPALFLIKNGKILTQWTGYRSCAEMITIIQDALNG